MKKIFSILGLTLILNYPVFAAELNYIYNGFKNIKVNSFIPELICNDPFIKDVINNVCIEKPFSIVNQTTAGLGSFTNNNTLTTLARAFDGDLTTQTNSWYTWMNGSNITGNLFLDRPVLNRKITIHWRDHTGNGWGLKL